MASHESGIEAVVFDLLFTLVHPHPYPGGGSRIDWLSRLLEVDPAALGARWRDFELDLEAGRALGDDGQPPELTWLIRASQRLGVTVSSEQLAMIDADWDLTRRQALASPPHSTLRCLAGLRERGLRIGVLSNTHQLELRSWPRSPLANMVDAVAFSHEIGVCKPQQGAYQRILTDLGVPTTAAAYVGDGGNGELDGAREAGFRTVILAEEAPRHLTPSDLPRLRAQSDASVSTLSEVPALIDGLTPTEAVTSVYR